MVLQNKHKRLASARYNARAGTTSSSSQDKSSHGQNQLNHPVRPKEFPALSANTHAAEDSVTGPPSSRDDATLSEADELSIAEEDEPGSTLHSRTASIVSQRPQFSNRKLVPNLDRYTERDDAQADGLADDKVSQSERDQELLSFRAKQLGLITRQLSNAQTSDQAAENLSLINPTGAFFDEDDDVDHAFDHIQTSQRYRDMALSAGFSRKDQLIITPESAEDQRLRQDVARTEAARQMRDQLRHARAAGPPGAKGDLAQTPMDVDSLLESL